MLVTRLTTAGLLAPLIIGGILLLPAAVTATGFGVFFLTASWEWTRLSGWRTLWIRGGYVLVAAALAVAAYQCSDMPRAILMVTGGASIWWCAAVVWIVGYESRSRPLPGGARASGVVGLFVLLPAWTAVMVLLNRDAEMLVALFALIWSADGAAYFIGRRWGRKKLAPRTSPGKTWAGLWAALAASLLLAAGISVGYGWSATSGLLFCIVALITVAVSIVGDLVESLYKRSQSLKDSGTILPGHGGVLDRIDSLLAAAPVFVFGLNLVPRP